MEDHKPLDILQQTEEAIWVDKINEARLDGKLCAWVSTLNPGQSDKGQAHCELTGGFANGSYNICQGMRFDDGTILVLRLPRVSSISPDYADEKVAMEVEALDLIRTRTTIPVPKVHAWGLAKDNPLGLGPFILIEYIDGVMLKDLFMGVRSGNGSRLLREDIPDGDVECIYRQMANFMLQLFKIDFPHIGSLPALVTGFPAPIRPLTWKAHDILRSGGVDTFGDRTKGFQTTTEYFEYVLQQDFQQLRQQPNSVVCEGQGESLFAALKILESMMPTMINQQYDHGPFKLICDDFGPANVLVRSPDDLTIVGVIDLEWVYAGPAQLFASAPWWLLLDRPINEEWDFDINEPPPVAERYLKALEMFKRVLSEEEGRMTGHDEKEVSKLVQWSEDSGAIWYHMLVSSGFFDWFGFPFKQLQRRAGMMEVVERMKEIKDLDEVKEFGARKLRELEEYDRLKEQVIEYKSLMDSGEMATEEFLVKVRAILGKSL